MSKNQLDIEIGQWIVRDDGKVMKVTADDMAELPYERIERYATKEEILANGGCPIDLEYRMYYFVPYNISDIQKGIQGGHAMGEYILKYGKGNITHKVWTFLEQWKTWMIYNGGTTNSMRDFTGVSYGSLNQIADALADNDVEFGYFTEPDLNEALTAVCFLADERVFDKETYPEFWDFLAAQDGYDSNTTRIEVKTTPVEEWAEKYGQHFINWKEDVLGGDENFFLRELIRDKKWA